MNCGLAPTMVKTEAIVFQFQFYGRSNRVLN
jgi:hypothetical protein